MPGQGSTYIGNLYTWLRTGKRFRPSFPRAIQLQTQSTCNARCIFCPHCQYPSDIIHGKMDIWLFRKIVDECAKHYVSRISPYLTNEPLMDKRISDMISYITHKKKICTRTKINTNGSLLAAEMSHALLDAGLDQLWISVNGYTPESYNKAMQLDISTVLNNIDHFLFLKEKLKKKCKVVITTINTSIVASELDYAKAYWSKRDVKFNIHSLDNRAGGNIENLLPENIRPIPKRNCDLFLKQAYIVENGDMILCCHDWRQSVKIGNVAETSIYDVWNSQRFKELIWEYYEGRYENLKICETCA
ncbi:MAG: radical SAM/SPASM domain-containing protein [Thermodesulfobacteriota bacterium]